MEVLDPAACHRQVSSPRTLATQAGSGDLVALVLAPHPAELGPRPLRGLIAASAVVSIVCSTSVCESRPACSSALAAWTTARTTAISQVAETSLRKAPSAWPRSRRGMILRDAALGQCSSFPSDR